MLEFVLIMRRSSLVMAILRSMAQVGIQVSTTMVFR